MGALLAPGSLAPAQQAAASCTAVDGPQRPGKLGGGWSDPDRASAFLGRLLEISRPKESGGWPWFSQGVLRNEHRFSSGTRIKSTLTL